MSLHLPASTPISLSLTTHPRSSSNPYRVSCLAPNIFHTSVSSRRPRLVSSLQLSSRIGLSMLVVFNFISADVPIPHPVLTELNPSASQLYQSRILHLSHCACYGRRRKLSPPSPNSSSLLNQLQSINCTAPHCPLLFHHKLTKKKFMSLSRACFCSANSIVVTRTYPLYP